MPRASLRDTPVAGHLREKHLVLINQSQKNNSGTHTRLQASLSSDIMSGHHIHIYHIPLCL